MTASSLQGSTVLVIGAGIMGAGIAQVAAQAGHRVQLFDARKGAAAQARTQLDKTLQGLVTKGKLDAAQAQATLGRIEPIAALDPSRDARLVIEAIVENLEAKRALLRQLEAIVDDDCILATNTSSISVTALGNGLKHPRRLVGMHFFNPVPLMKLVEVVSGLQTDCEVAQAIFDLSKTWGKVPVHARSTPGFVVNRIARPYYAETLALLLERAAAPQVLDACFRAAGFRMGPCELMDLIGHDTNFAVTQSVYEANFYDKRFVPSLVQREMVDGGLLGRKCGQGFYRYPEGAPALPAPQAPVAATAQGLSVHGTDPIADHLAQTLSAALGVAPTRQPSSDWVGLSWNGARLVLTDGRTAAELAQSMGIDHVAVFDRLCVMPATPGSALAFAMAPQASAECCAQVQAWLATLGYTPCQVADTPGLLVARTLAMLINEAADAVLQGVCSPQGADAAMKLGVNYPAGPFEWLSRWSAGGVRAVLTRLDDHYRGERYRISPWLRRAP
jgi:3-hydroxybutyryl-CoA dehydrogenase